MNGRTAAVAASVLLPSFALAISGVARGLTAGFTQGGPAASLGARDVQGGAGQSPGRAPAATGTAGATSASSAVALTEIDLLTLTLEPRARESDAHTARTALFVRNAGDSAAQLACVRAVLRDSSGQVAVDTAATFSGGACPTGSAPPQPLTLPAWSITPVRVRITIPPGVTPYVGYLVMQIWNPASGNRHIQHRPVQLRAATRARWESGANRIVLDSVAAAALAVALALAFALWHRGAERETLLPGPDGVAPAWDPKTSWASNVGVAGGILTALLGIAFLPDQPHYLAKTTYGLLSALFPALIGAAPSVYVYLSRISASGRLQVGAMLLASFVTLWGAFGQLATAWALVGELEPVRLLPTLAVTWVQGLVLAVALLMLLYAVKSMHDFIRSPPPSAGAPINLGAEVRVARSRWTLL